MQPKLIIRVPVTFALLTIALMSGACWNGNSIQEVSHVSIETGFTRALSVSPSGDYLAVGSDTGFHVYQVESAQEIWSESLENGAVVSSFSANGTMVAAGSLGVINIWRVETGELLNTYEFGGGDRQFAQLTFSPDDRLLGFILQTYPPSEAVFWDLDAEEVMFTIANPGWIVWESDSRRVGLVSCISPWLLEVATWDLEAGEHLHTTGWEYDGPMVTEPCGFYMACGCDIVIGNDSTIHAAERYWREVTIWDTETWERVYEFENNRVVSDIAWSPEGDVLAVGLEDGTVILWDVANREAAHTFEGQGSGVYNLIWSLDGSTLAYTSGGVIMVWRIQP